LVGKGRGGVLQARCAEMRVFREVMDVLGEEVAGGLGLGEPCMREARRETRWRQVL
jgi:hypothetical protein